MSFSLQKEAIMQHHTLLPRRLHTLIAILLFGLLAQYPAAPLRAAGVLHVVPGGAGAQTGVDWANAKDLQAALAAATSGDQIWVKSGIYKPTTGADHSATFQLKSGVAIYGGFAGAEADLGQRDPVTHLSILSGDLLGNDSGALSASNPTRTDNSYHVVNGSGVDNSAILDGFTITAGNAYANITNFSDFNGGGMLNNNGSPIISRVIFSENVAANDGGGMANNHSSPMLSHVVFSNNAAGLGGGLINDYGSAPTLSHVRFVNNGSVYGGGMANVNSLPIVSNAVFESNLAGQAGGAIFNIGSSPAISNAIFNSNVSMVVGGGIFNSEHSNLTLSGVTLVSNTAASNGGGLWNSNSSPIIRNSIVWGNSGRQIQNDSSSSTPDVQYSLIQGGYITGTHILDADPLFVDAGGADDIAGTADDNLRLQAASPAIDAGSNAFIPSDLTDENNNNDVDETAPFDLDRHPRLDGSLVDLGAYETQLHLQITSALPPPGRYGSSYSHTFTSSVNTPVTYSVTAGTLPPGLTFNAATGTLSGIPTSAGSYTGITISASSSNGSASQTCSITIDRAALTIHADNKTRILGAPNPQLTASYIGLVNGDTATSLDTPVQLSTTATTTSPPGRYPITASGASDANYDSTFMPGTLTVTDGHIYLAVVSR